MSVAVNADLIETKSPTAAEDDLRFVEGLVEDDGGNVLVGLLEKVENRIPRQGVHRERAEREE